MRIDGRDGVDVVVVEGDEGGISCAGVGEHRRGRDVGVRESKSVPELVGERVLEVDDVG